MRGYTGTIRRIEAQHRPEKQERVLRLAHELAQKAQSTAD
jgi:hypothetical protein